MRKRKATIAEIQAERARILFDVETLEKEIRSIEDQLEEAEFATNPERQKNTNWWIRARDAKGHKERQRRVLLARSERLQREMDRVQPDEKKEEAKAALRDVMQTLFLVARASLSFYEDESAKNEEALTEALDQLDRVVPGWDIHQDRDPFELKKLQMGQD